MHIEPLRQSRRAQRLAPLVDVVFLLLMFFLLAGILEPLPPLEVGPPEAEHAQSGDGEPLRVLLDADGRIAYEGEVRDAKALAEADGQAAVNAVLALLKAFCALGFEDVRLATRPMMLESDDAR